MATNEEILAAFEKNAESIVMLERATERTTVVIESTLTKLEVENKELRESLAKTQTCLDEAEAQVVKLKAEVQGLTDCLDHRQEQQEFH